MFVSVILVGLSSIGSAQQVVLAVPEYVPPVSFSEILKGLGDETVHSYFDRNRDLCREVESRGIGFGLGTNAKDVLIKAGASEALISKITNGQEKRSKEIPLLWEQLYKANNLQTRFEVGRELRDLIGDPQLLVGKERDWTPIYTLVKARVPEWETGLERIRRSKPTQ